MKDQHDPPDPMTGSKPGSVDPAFDSEGVSSPASEALYKLLVEHIPAMVYLSAPDDPGDVRFVSPQVETQLGYTPEEWLSKPHFWKDILHPDDREVTLRIDHESALSGDSFDMQYRLMHRDGYPVWLSDQGSLIRDDDGTPLFWLGFTFDISDQKHVEGALSEAEVRYRMLVEQVPAVIFTVGVDHIHHPIYLSPQVEAMFGYTREEWDSDNEFWLKLIHPDDLSRAMAEVERTEATGDSYSCEYRMFASDGRIVWVQNESTLVYDSQGQPAFWQGVLLDVTDRKQAENALREAESRYRTLVEQISVVTFIEPLDGKGAPSYVSPQIEDLLGYSSEYWREHPDIGVRSIHPDDYDRWAAEVERTDASGEPFDLVHRMISRDGSVVWIRSRSQLLRDEHGVPLFWQGTMQDITDAMLADQRLAESEQRYRSLFDHNPNPVYSFDLDGIMVSANAALADLNGYTVDEMLGKSYKELVAPDDVQFVTRHFEATVEGVPQSYECSILCRHGGEVTVSVTNMPIIVGGEIVGVFGVARDVSERRELERQLQHMAFHDPLTDLPNRLLFMDRLEQALAAIPRLGTSIAVLFIDLDNFKTVNDSFGHDTGDKALRRIAEEIHACVRAGDTISRLGGDEFTVLLQNVANEADALDIADRILQRFRRPLLISGQAVHISVSIGVVLSSSADDDPETLIRHGDVAMYQAKSGGKARYQMYEHGDAFAAE